MSATARLAALLAVLACAACSGQKADAPMSGYAEAELVYLAPSSAGLLQTLAVKRGDKVTRGQPVFALDADAEARYRQTLD